MCYGMRGGGYYSYKRADTYLTAFCQKSTRLTAYRVKRRANGRRELDNESVWSDPRKRYETHNA